MGPSQPSMLGNLNGVEFEIRTNKPQLFLGLGSGEAGADTVEFLFPEIAGGFDGLASTCPMAAVLKSKKMLKAIRKLAPHFTNF